jgi:galactose dehydrogenase
MAANPYPFRPEEFAGKVAAVTGGSDGLGRHLVETLCGYGAEVFFCGRRVELGKQVEASVGTKGHFIQADLADAAQARGFIETAGGLRGHIDYLVNNAAVDQRLPFDEATAEDFDRMMQINLRPHFITMQAARPLLKKGAGRAVVNVSSTSYMFGNAPLSIYTAAKAGIVGLTRSLAREMGPDGIRVNALTPGWIMTERQLREFATEEAKKYLVSQQCVKEVMEPRHVTPVTLFLLSSAAVGMSGQNLVVDGGNFLQ